MFAVKTTTLVLTVVALVHACGDADNSQTTTTSTTELTPGATPVTTASPTPVATPLPTETASLPPIPGDWPTHNDPDGLFAIRVPPTWLELGGHFFLLDPRNSGPGWQPETIKVEVAFNSAAGSTTCGGTLNTDLETGQETGHIAYAVATTLGGFPAWRWYRDKDDPVLEGGVTRIERIALVHKGYCVFLTGYFTQQEPDITTFLQIASTFEFNI